MKQHSIAPLLEKVTGLKPDPKNPRPIPSRLLMEMPDIPALDTRKVSFQSRASRTFHVQQASRTAPRIIPSNLSKGAWEIDGAITDWGLPGRKIIDLRSKRHGKKGRRTPSVSGFIPSSAPIVTNPQPYFGPRRPRLSRASDGRVHELHVRTRIFQYESRVALLPLGYPFWAVCRLTFFTRMSSSEPWKFRQNGTGFMASRSVCVTASHVFPDPPFAEWMVEVVPGMIGGVSAHGPGLITNAHTVLRGVLREPGTDIMVMGLYDPIGDVTGAFGIMDYNSDWEDESRWTMTGYPWDFFPYGSTEFDIAVYDDDYGPNMTLPNGDWWESLQIETYADTASGLSGAPLWGWFDNGLACAIGVHRGTELSGANSVASGGRLLRATVGWAIQQWG